MLKTVSSASSPRHPREEQSLIRETISGQYFSASTGDWGQIQSSIFVNPIFVNPIFVNPIFGKHFLSPLSFS
ncbi:MAG: hypothetical protein ACI9OJ_005005, partial [Myxococcota bacterium]